MVRLISVFLLTLFVLSTGCKKVFVMYVNQSQGGDVIFRFEPDQSTHNEGMAISNLYVARVISSDKPRQMMWWIRSKSGKPEKVLTVTYGLVPVGFEQVEPAKSLVAGQAYEAMSWTIDESGSADFNYGQ